MGMWEKFQIEDILVVKKSVNFQSTSCVSGVLLDAGNRKMNWMGPLAFKGVTDNYTNNYHTVRLVLGWGLAQIPVKAVKGGMEAGRTR